MSEHPAAATSDTRGARVGGWVSPGYELVADAFIVNLVDRGDTGAAFAAYVDGVPVVDVWGGQADTDRAVPWQQDTPCLIFSGTKALTATCVLRLVDHGSIDLDAALAAYWPEFAAHDKAAITVRDVLTHQARLPGLRTPTTLEEVLRPGAAARILADQPAEDDDRAAYTYHPLTFGWLCDELVYRVTGQRVGEFFRTEIADSHQLDITIGTDRARQRRTAVLKPHAATGQSLAWNAELYTKDALLTAIWGNPVIFGPNLDYNRAAFLSAQVPGANAVATADAMARFYRILIDPSGPLLSPPLLALASTVQVQRLDRITGKHTAFGLGFAVQGPTQEFGPAVDGFGHTGAGGSVHGAWPSQRTSFSYITNDLRDFTDPDPRAQTLLNALYSCVRRTRSSTNPAARATHSPR